MANKGALAKVFANMKKNGETRICEQMREFMKAKAAMYPQWFGDWADGWR